jgi:hypothetical protein
VDTPTTNLSPLSLRIKARGEREIEKGKVKTVKTCNLHEHFANFQPFPDIARTRCAPQQAEYNFCNLIDNLARRERTGGKDKSPYRTIN